MATDFTDETATEAVLDSFRNTSDPRLREVLCSMVSHLHAFVREVEPTHQEWEQAVEFLTAVGQKCDDVRQEFILLSDVLGVSTLVDAINNRRPAGATESTVLGPFHVVDSPAYPLGADIALDGKGERCVVAGTIRGLDGTPLPDAAIDVWQADSAGLYDVQAPDLLPEQNLRGLFTASREGRFWFRSVVPRYYPIPDDGPVGNLLRRTGRHPNRPAHIHFIASAEGYSPITTHLFIEGSPYLDSDTVFGVKKDLIRPVKTVDDLEQARRYGIDNPFRLVEFDIVLDKAGPAPQQQRTRDGLQ